MKYLYRKYLKILCKETSFFCLIKKKDIESGKHSFPDETKMLKTYNLYNLNDINKKQLYILQNEILKINDEILKINDEILYKLKKYKYDDEDEDEDEDIFGPND